MTTKKAVKKVVKKSNMDTLEKRLEELSMEMMKEEEKEVQFIEEMKRRGVYTYIRSLQTLNLTKAFLLFTAGMLAGAVIMKFL